MPGWIEWWFDSRNYMPHGSCYLWQPAVLWLNVGSDAAIAMAYMTIPLVIGRFARTRAREFQFGWVSLLFASFIFLCGMTHLFEVYTAWTPLYRMAGLLKLATAIVSVGTAVTLVFVMPGVMALRTPRQLELEVVERTRQLQEANRLLELEIAAHRDAEQALIATQQQLRDSDRRKDEFLATLAHELRNPLAPIRTSLAIVETVELAPPAFGRAVNIMKRQVGQMVRLIEDLLDVSRISTGRISLRPETVVVQDIIRHAVETVQPLLDSAPHHLSLALPAEPMMVEADPTRLAQVLSNLLSNSAKYMHPGGEVQVRAYWDRDEVCVEVEDAGFGIAAQDLERVFDMFGRIEHPLAPLRSGLGIGLALSRRLIELHGGQLTVSSEGLGKGSCFRLTLPGLLENAEQGSKGTASSSASLAEGDWTHRRVLVVDDHADVADALVDLFSGHGLAARSAYGGEEALTVGRSWHPHVIFLDLSMPGRDGLSTAAAVRSEAWGREVMLIAVTGHAQAVDRERTRLAGFDGHFAKPMDPELALTIAREGKHRPGDAR